MTTLRELEKEIEKIKARNRRVEADKTWETCKTRKFIVAVFTYLAIALYLRAINLPNPWLNAIVPTVAFLLSTLTIPSFKKVWMNRIYKK